VKIKKDTVLIDSKYPNLQIRIFFCTKTSKKGIKFMGTWYETDFLSHLHIEEGENAVMIQIFYRNPMVLTVG